MDGFKCSIIGCKNKGPFSTESLLSRHFKTAHSSVKFGCYLCQRKFTDQAVIFMHLNINHKIEIPDKTQITLHDGPNIQLIGFLEVEERNEYLDESNGVLTNEELDIFPSDVAEFIQVIDSAKIKVSKEISPMEDPLIDTVSYNLYFLPFLKISAVSNVKFIQKRDFEIFPPGNNM